MSYTTIKAVWPGEKVQDLEEMRNSHGSAPFVWNELSKQYFGLKDHEYMFQIEQLWPLYKRPCMPDHHRALLMMTFDGAMLYREDYQQAAADVRAFLADFPPRPEHANHWPRIAEILEGNPDCPAIGFHWTSVDCDSWSEEWDEESGESLGIDWSGYWNLYADIRLWSTKEFDRLRRENKELQARSDIAAERDLNMVGLLRAAKCPQCDGSGAVQAGPDDIYQCQWCYERDEVIATHNPEGDES